jgi:hypothetical protein
MLVILLQLPKVLVHDIFTVSKRRAIQLEMEASKFFVSEFETL